MFVPQSRVRSFHKNAPNPPRWTLNSCFVALRSVWMHLDPFRYCFKLHAKLAELVQLMQKFMPWSRVGIYRNERTWSTPLDQKRFVVFRSVWVHLGPFRYCMKLGAKWAELMKLMQKSVPEVALEFFATSTPDPTHTTLNSCFRMFHSVRCIWDCFVTAVNSMQNGLNWYN